MSALKNQGFAILENNEEEDNSSRNHRRIIKEEVEREEFLNDAQIITQSAEIISIHANNSQLLDLTDDFLEREYSEDELAQFIEELTNDISDNFSKDRIRAKKRLEQLLELLTTAEHILRLNQKNPELQNNLRQTQEKFSNLVKDPNITKMQELLKSSELKTMLQQSVNIAAKPLEKAQLQEVVTQRINSAQNPDMINRLANQTRDTPQRDLSSQLIQRTSPPTPDRATQLATPNLAKPVAHQLATAAVLISNIQQPQQSIIPNKATEQTIYRETLVNKIEASAEKIPTNQANIDTAIKPAQSPATPSETKTTPPTSGHVHSGNCCGASKPKFNQPIESNILKQAESAFKPRASEGLAPNALPTSEQVQNNKAAAATVKF